MTKEWKISGSLSIRLGQCLRFFSCSCSSLAFSLSRRTKKICFSEGSRKTLWMRIYIWRSWRDPDSLFLTFFHRQSELEYGICEKWECCNFHFALKNTMLHTVCEGAMLKWKWSCNYLECVREPLHFPLLFTQRDHCAGVEKIFFWFSQSFTPHFSTCVCMGSEMDLKA